MIPAPIAPTPAPTASRSLYLTDAQQTDIYHQSRNHAVSFLQNSLSDLHEWEFISEKKSVQFYRKKSNDGTTYTINGITRIVADLDETMRTLYCEDTTALSDLFSQLHDDAFADGAVLAALPAKRDPSGICREQCSIKNLSFRPFNAMDKARQYTVVDYCTIRTGKAEEGNCGDTTDNRLGIQLMYSTDAVDPTAATSTRRLASSSSLATATSSFDESSASQLLPSGFIVYPTAKKGVLEVIFSWSAHDPRGISRGYKKSILSLVASVARLENIFLALRIAAAGFIKSKNWYGRFKARSNYIKSMLTEKNKENHMKFALSFLSPWSQGNHVLKNMYDFVHVDEKWFFMTKVKRKFYVYEDEEMALRSAKHKNQIMKVMFFAAVARPRYDYKSRRFFDGKLGI
ncbi:hypothetical protein H310_01684 [Aphanomyces invadans]|uniref:Uncharacterized protein n=1 Tax=Aphanomyces invadans TaxID=157072 RepID=A0A024UTN9_9STRA|nr:hypothetical protein H310_01684 [Aphanomyces invadans]ETW09292.1 hypothetical protein H310_01684 [Aphanomyces invadans]|eukprot:XP_008863097.1 hypothetical protein H310_01684 [Aphanomyces invadans]